MKNLDEFYEEVLKSKDLQKEFVSCKKDEDIQTFLSSHGCDAKVIDVKKFLQKKFDNEGKVNDKELESLSGGCEPAIKSAAKSTVISLAIAPYCMYKLIKTQLKEDHTDDADCMPA